MNDFIDREKLKLQIAKQSRYFGFGFITKIMDIIKELPSADTERHAHWLFMGDVGVTKCSKCDWSICECLNDYEYCPNCGAKMDEVIGHDLL